jgi:succinate dehydrogenase / fumarate reductase cytochrome b subunit
VRARPLSPHLQIWRWHITMACSILHRVSIFAIYFGLLLLSAWALSLAAGPQAYITYIGLIGSPLGLLILFGVSVMLFFNLAYNIRQAFWDMGKGFELKIADATGWACIAFAIVAALVLWAGLIVSGAFQ